MELRCFYFQLYQLQWSLIAGHLLPKQEVEIPVFSAAMQTKQLKASLIMRSTLPGCQIHLGCQQSWLNIEEIKAGATPAKFASTATPAFSTTAQPERHYRPSRKSSACGSFRNQLGGRRLNVDLHPPSMGPQQGHHSGAQLHEARQTRKQILSEVSTVSGEPQRQCKGADALEDINCSTEWRESVEVIEVAEGTIVTAITLHCSTLRPDCDFQTEIGELTLSGSLG